VRERRERGLAAVRPKPAEGIAGNGTGVRHSTRRLAAISPAKS
jgi:hypothetical protein